MKSGEHDKSEGSGKDLKGHAKELLGRATGDREKEREGKADQAQGHGQKAKGDAKKTFGQ